MQKLIKTEILNQGTVSIKKASSFLKDDKLVSFPTETVYGLGASAISNNGIAKIFAVKGRPKYNPLIVHIADKQDVFNWAIVPEVAKILIENFWPGALTLVLKQKKVKQTLASLVTGNLETVAMRMPMHSTARALITELGSPIAAPSANISGKISPTRAQDVMRNLDGKISAIIKGDNCLIGLESTIISCVNKRPTLLRPGGIPLETIEEKIGQKILISNHSYLKKKKIIAPGMMSSHYSPDSKLRLNREKPEVDELFLGFGAMPTNSMGLNLSPSGNLEQAASNFFATLADIDVMAKMMNRNTISVATIPNFGLGVAINDRLERAAAPKT